MEISSDVMLDARPNIIDEHPGRRILDVRMGNILCVDTMIRFQLRPRHDFMISKRSGNQCAFVNVTDFCHCGICLLNSIDELGYDVKSCVSNLVSSQSQYTDALGL